MGLYWHKVNASKLHFARSSQGYHTWPSLARQNTPPKFNIWHIWHIWLYLAYLDNVLSKIKKVLLDRTSFTRITQVCRMMHILSMLILPPSLVLGGIWLAFTWCHPITKWFFNSHLQKLFWPCNIFIVLSLNASKWDVNAPQYTFGDWIHLSFKLCELTICELDWLSLV